MRKLLAELRIEKGEGLDRLIDHAWVIHASREPESAFSRPVSGSSILAAAVDLDDNVAKPLIENGLNVSLWKKLLKVDETAVIPEPPDDYPVGPEVTPSSNRTGRTKAMGLSTFVQSPYISFRKLQGPAGWRSAMQGSRSIPRSLYLVETFS